MKTIAIALILTLPAGLALAQTHSLELPGLTGGYEASPWDAPNFGHPQMRSVDITIPASVTSIDQIQLVMSGDWTIGEVACDNGMGPEPSPFQVPFGLYVASDDWPGDYFRATIMPEGGAFSDLTGDLSSCCPPGVLEFDALLGRELHIELFADWALIGICWITSDTYGTVSDVRLEITGTVAADASTWSDVKALYH